MDQELQRQVWQRVRPGQDTEQALLPDQLEALLREEQENAGAARQLARRLRGADAAVLRRLASEEEDRARQLRTVCYLLTGRRLGQKTPVPPLQGTLPEQLRALYHRQKRLSELYRQLAARFSGEAETFEALRTQARRHADALSRLLKHRL